MKFFEKILPTIKNRKTTRETTSISGFEEPKNISNSDVSKNSNDIVKLDAKNILVKSRILKLVADN